MALGFGSALLGWSNHTQVELHLVQINSANNQLQKLLLWWNSLSIIQKRIPANKEHLVTTTEALMLAKIVGRISDSEGAKKDGQEDGNGNGNGEGGSKETKRD